MNSVGSDERSRINYHSSKQYVYDTHVLRNFDLETILLKPVSHHSNMLLIKKYPKTKATDEAIFC